MDKDAIVKALKEAHKALTAAGEAAGGEGSSYQMLDDLGNEIPSFDELAKQVQAL